LEFLKLQNHSSYLLVKNLLVNELNKLLDVFKNQDEDFKLVTHICANILFILSKFTYKIDYYIIFLNYLVTQIKKQFLIFFEDNFEGFHNSEKLYDIYKIASIYFNLKDKYCKEIASNISQEESTPIHQQTFKALYFYNFHHIFLKDEIRDEEYFNISNPFKIAKTISFKRARKIKPKNNHTLKSYNNKLENIPELLLYYNSKLVRWKSYFLEESKTEKCRICEKEIQLQKFGFHSYICTNRVEWRASFTQANKDLKSLSNKVLSLNLQYSNSIDLNYSQAFRTSSSKLLNLLEYDIDVNESRLKNSKLLTTLRNICQSQVNIKLTARDEYNKKEFNNLNKLIYRLLLIQNKLIFDKELKDISVVVNGIIVALMKKYNTYNDYFDIKQRFQEEAMLDSSFIDSGNLSRDTNTSINNVNMFKFNKSKSLQFDISNKRNKSKFNIGNVKQKTLKQNLTTTVFKKRCSETMTKCLKDVKRLSSEEIFHKANSEEYSNSHRQLIFSTKDELFLSPFNSYATESDKDVEAPLKSYDSSDDNVLLNSMLLEDDPKSCATAKKSKFFNSPKNEKEIKEKEEINLVAEDDNIECFICKKVTCLCDCNYIENFNLEEGLNKSFSCSSEEDDNDDLEIINKINTILAQSTKSCDEAGNDFNEKPVSINDFETIEIISEGGYGIVSLAKKKTTNDLYAIKKINKLYLKKKNLFTFIENEKAILTNINNDFIVKCYYTFSDMTSIYFVMEYLNGGDLSYMLSKFKGINEKYVKQYTAEILLALEYLHKNDIIHRDLKPENIMFDERGHIKLTDFGLSEFSINENIKNYKLKFSKFDRLSLNNNNKHSSKVYGTENYLAPELILGTKHGKEVDYWALGVIIYELLLGDPPFLADNKDKVFDNILERRINWPSGANSLSQEAHDIIEGLLNLNPMERLGAKGAGEIKDSPFFKEIDFENIKKEKFLFIPKTDSKQTAIYFNKKRVTFKTQDHPQLEADKSESVDDSVKRDDLLHKRNIIFYDELFRKIKKYDFTQLLSLRSMLIDVGIGDDS
jgi:serine/threonine protein kinase